MSSNGDDRNESSFGHFLMAVLGGAVAGAVVAYFTAPRSGVESRRQLRAAADDARDTVHRVTAALHKATEAARDAFNEALTESSDVTPV